MVLAAIYPKLHYSHCAPLERGNWLDRYSIDIALLWSESDSTNNYEHPSDNLQGIIGTQYAVGQRGIQS